MGFKHHSSSMGDRLGTRRISERKYESSLYDTLRFRVILSEHGTLNKTVRNVTGSVFLSRVKRATESRERKQNGKVIMRHAMRVCAKLHSYKNILCLFMLRPYQKRLIFISRSTSLQPAPQQSRNSMFHGLVSHATLPSRLSNFPSLEDRTARYVFAPYACTMHIQSHRLKNIGCVLPPRKTENITALKKRRGHLSRKQSSRMSEPLYVANERVGSRYARAR